MNINWMMDFNTYPQALSDLRVFKMFVKAWNERKSVISIFDRKYTKCDQGKVPYEYVSSGGYFTYPEQFPMPQEGGMANTTNQENYGVFGYKYQTKATFENIDDVTIIYSNLTSGTILIGSRLVIGSYRATVLSTDLDNHKVVVDVAPNTKPTPASTILFLGQFYDPTVTVHGWFKLINEVIDYCGYFIKNRESDYGLGNVKYFFIDKPSWTSWLSEPDPIIRKQDIPKTWPQNINEYRSYGPKSIPSMFTRKFPREITLLDGRALDAQNNPILDENGRSTYQAKFLNQSTLSGEIFIRTEVGFLSENDPLLSTDFPYALPQKGQLARLVRNGQGFLDPDNQSFKYYVVGNVFKFDGDNWVEQHNFPNPDILEVTGRPQKGDYIGLGLINTLRDAINLLGWTYILPIGALGNDTTSIGAAQFGDPNLFIPIYRTSAALKSFTQNATRISFHNAIANPLNPDISAKFYVGDRVVISGDITNLDRFYTSIKSVSGSTITLNAPIPFKSNSFGTITSYSNFTNADVDEVETRWKKTLKLKNVDSVIQNGMLVYAGKSFLGIVQSYVAPKVTLDRVSRVPITDRLFFTQEVIPPYYSFGDFGPSVAFNIDWLVNQYSYLNYPANLNVLGIEHVGDDLHCFELFKSDHIHIANPSGLWGAFPVYSATGGELGPIVGHNPDSRNLVREYDYYDTINNNISTFGAKGVLTILTAQPEDYVPKLPPKFQLAYSITVRVEPKDVTKDPIENIYSTKTGHVATFKSLIVCRWDVPGGFVYTKDRTQNEP